MPEQNEGLYRRLTAPENPRTPLFFKFLQHFTGEAAQALVRHAFSRFYRSDGYVAGPTTRPHKPITKLFRRYDE